MGAITKPEQTKHPRSRRLLWGALASLLALAALSALIAWRFAVPVQAVRQDGADWVADRGDYAGPSACRRCHADLVTAQLASNHARTCRDLARQAPLAPFGTGQEVIDPFTGARYTMERSAGRPAIAVAQGKLRASQELQFEFGSGAHACGYLARLDDNSWIDTRLNYYQETGGWDFTSSQDQPHAYLVKQPLGRPLNAAQAVSCFTCHSAVVRVQSAARNPVDMAHARLRPDASLLGVTCEACHGPRGEHARSPQSPPAGGGDANLSADAINSMCGRCHGLTNVNPDHPVITRFQPWGLAQSRCYRESAGRLSCVTCHDPHTNAVHNMAFYEAKCLSCHTPGAASIAKTVCPVNRTSGCVGCHMPGDSKSMLHVTFYDHRIRVVRQPLRGGTTAR